MGGTLDVAELKRTVIDAALRAGDPARALEAHWKDPPPGPVFLAAFGKASAAMAQRACEQLGERLASGVVIGVPGRIEGATLPAQIEKFAADHPLPTERNVRAALALRAGLERFAAEHPGGTVVCLISGGGSAHLTLPSGGLTLEDLRAVSEALQRAGAPIGDLNAVRKHTESLKGGRLAALASPARVMAYVLSDVIGDSLDTVASGPMSPDPTTFENALAVLERFGCEDAAERVTEHLRSLAGSATMETPKPGSRVFARVSHTIIANNRAAVDGVRVAIADSGMRVHSVRYDVTGEASELGRRLAREAGAAPRGSCVIVGGEPTVSVGASHGRGGPSQELALACVVEMVRAGSGNGGVIAFSTDGVDGPTDAAGAVIRTEDLRAGSDPEGALREHDSYGLLDRMSGLIRTGHTGTNVNHVAVAWV